MRPTLITFATLLLIPLAGCDEDACLSSAACEKNGVCSTGTGGSCVVGDSADCLRSTGCDDDGLCTAKQTSCPATPDASINDAGIATFADLGTPCLGTVKRCVAGADSDCSRASVCKKSGGCSASPAGACVPTSDGDCKRSTGCTEKGNCALKGAACAPSSNSHCSASSGCSENGLCAFSSAYTKCIAGSDAHCKSANVACSYHGKCAMKSGECVATSATDCRGSGGCSAAGLCSLSGTACVAATDADCRTSRACTKNGQCKASGGSCI